MTKSLALCLVLGAVCLLSSPVTAGEPNVRFPEAAGVPDITKPPYNARGDGKTDDTAAFQQALKDGHALIYIPEGVYVISDTLRWGKGQKRQTLQGQSMNRTVIRIKDHAPSFQDPLHPRPMIWTGQHPAQRFRNGVRNLTLDIGKGNPGAIGAQFIANNQGGMEYVTIRDPHGVGRIGLDLGYTKEQGPCLLKHVTVEGFEVGVSLKHAVDSVTAEYLTLKHQRTVGIRNTGQVLSIRKLHSHQHGVPAIVNTDVAMLTLLDSKLIGEDTADIPAIQNHRGLFARNVDTPGYRLAVENHSGHRRHAEGQRIEEYVSHEPLHLFPSPPTSLGLPIKETPEVEWEPIEKWVSVLDFGEPEPITLRRVKKDGKEVELKDWTPLLQRAIDSGATTIYFPRGHGKFGLFGEIHIRKNVKRIIGLENTGVTMTDSNRIGTFFADQTMPTFILEDGSAPVVVVERFDTWYMPFRFIQNSDRTLVVRSLSTYGIHAKDKGEVFIEDCRTKRVRVDRGARVWARQLNPEGWREPRLLIDGGRMWVLGLKTEADATPAAVSNGGELEISGGFIYANKNAIWPKQMFINRGGSLTASVGEWVTRRDAPFNILIEHRDGQEKLMPRGTIYKRGSGSLVPLLVSYRPPADAPPSPDQGLKGEPVGTDRVKAAWTAPAKADDTLVCQRQAGEHAAAEDAATMNTR